MVESQLDLEQLLKDFPLDRVVKVKRGEGDFAGRSGWVCHSNLPNGEHVRISNGFAAVHVGFPADGIRASAWGWFSPGSFE